MIPKNATTSGYGPREESDGAAPGVRSEKTTTTEKRSFLADTGRLLPGIVFAGILAWFSVRIGNAVGVGLLGFEKSPISPVMMAILSGLVISNAVRLPAQFSPGLKFVVKKVLRLGIVLLGVRLSVVEVFRLGAVGIPIVLGCIAAALIFTTLLSRIVQLPEKLGTLIAVGTSICGVSAIVATGPAIESTEEEIAYAVSVITIFGLVATVVYPYLANLLFGGDPIKAGLFLGTAVQDTSQVTGAALLYSDLFSRPDTLKVAVVTKLIRNIFMAFVIPFMAYRYSRRKVVDDAAGNTVAAGRLRVAKFFPLFILGFVCMAAVRSVGDVTLGRSGAAFGFLSEEAWTGIHGFLKTWAVNLLVVALAGVGLSTRFKTLKRLGIKPFLTGLAAAVIVGGVSFLLISLLGRFISEV